MKKSLALLIFLFLILALLSGCAVLGLFEIEGAAAVGEAAAAITTTESFSAPVLMSDGAIVEAGATDIMEFRTIIRSDLNMDAYSLLKRNLPAAEFDLIDKGLARGEGAVNSLLTKVRVAQAGSASPRLFIKTGAAEGVEFAEVTSDETIKLLRSGKSYRLPGKIHTTKTEIFLRDLQNYRISAHINPRQVILVLDEVQVNGMLKVRIGTQTGLILASALFAVSHKTYSGPVYYNTYKYRSVPCAKCKGGGHLTCNKCSGRQRLLCPTCMGAKTLLCGKCSGSGKENCNICEGYGMLTCSSCQGTGRVSGEYCSTCSGRGTIFCKTCNGRGSVVCDVCLGKEVVICPNCNGTTWIVCDLCSGNGNLICQRCQGAGVNWIVNK